MERGRGLKATAEDRFWAKVTKTTGCWEWAAAKDHDGYGRFWCGGKMGPAHRFAYELLVGPVPEGLELDHLCRNPGCVNPVHLEAVTHRVNILRGGGPLAQQARQTHCKRGHEMAGENLYEERGHRHCLACDRDRQRSPERRAQRAAYDKARYARLISPEYRARKALYDKARAVRRAERAA